MNALILAMLSPNPGRPTGSRGEDGDFGYVFGPGAMPKLLILAMIGILVVSLWWHYRPCQACGEYREQCRCKPRDY